MVDDDSNWEDDDEEGILGEERWRAAYPSARAGPAAAAGPRAPPTASGAPATPCQRREGAAPRAAAAAAAAPPRRAITRYRATPTPASLCRTPAYSESNTIVFKFNPTVFIYRRFTTARRRPRVPSDPRASPTAPRVLGPSHGAFLSIVVQRSAADRGAAEPPVCGLAEAPWARSRAPPPPIHAPPALRPPARRPRPLHALLSDLRLARGPARGPSPSPHRSQPPPTPPASPAPPNSATAYYYANYLALFKICLPLIFHFCLKTV